MMRFEKNQKKYFDTHVRIERDRLKNWLSQSDLTNTEIRQQISDFIRLCQDCLFYSKLKQKKNGEKTITIDDVLLPSADDWDSQNFQNRYSKLKKLLEVQ